MSDPITIRWTGWDGLGDEHLVLHPLKDGTRVVSRITGAGGATACDLTYSLSIDPDWRLREARISIAGGPSLSLITDGGGAWRSGSGGPVDHLDGCVDIDISATPFTNTLPIRRENLAVGSFAEMRVAFVSIPDLALSAVEQKYTRIAASRYRYEGLSTGYRTELEVDGHGIVLDYPGLFRRV